MQRDISPIKDPAWWLYTDTHWILAFKINQKWRYSKCQGNFFEKVKELPLTIKEVHIFRSDGLHVRKYERVFNYFKISHFKITEFNQSDLESIWRILNRSIRQKIA